MKKKALLGDALVNFESGQHAEWGDFEEDENEYEMEKNFLYLQRREKLEHQIDKVNN